MDYPKDNSAIKDKTKSDNQPLKTDNDFLNQQDESQPASSLKENPKQSLISSQAQQDSSKEIKYPKKQSAEKKPDASGLKEQEQEVGVQDPQKVIDDTLSKSKDKPFLEVVEEQKITQGDEKSQAGAEGTSTISSGLSNYLSQKQDAADKKEEKVSGSLGINSDPLSQDQDLEKKISKQKEKPSDFVSTYKPQGESQLDEPEAFQDQSQQSSPDQESEKPSSLAGESEDEVDKSKLGPQPMTGLNPEKQEPLEETQEKSQDLDSENAGGEDGLKEEGKRDLSEEPKPSVAPISPPPPEPALAASKKSPFENLKKVFPIILGVLILGLIAFSVVKFVLPNLKPGSKQVELVYWGLWEPESVMNEIIADFERENPNIKVAYTMQSKQEYRERLQSALARGEGPDIFRFHITWVPMLKNQLEQVPESVFTRAQYQNTFYPVAVGNLLSGSGYLGVPLEVDTLALFYNKSIFQLAGKTPPKTWEELRTLANELTIRDSSGRIQTAGVALGNTTNVEHWSDILGLMMVQNGVDLKRPDSCSLVQGEEVCLGVDALRFYTIFSKTDQVWDNTMPNSTQAFALGKLAMYFGYSWDVFEFKARNPNLDFGVVEAPQLAGEKISWASFWVEGVNNKSQLKDEAWLFVKYLSQKESLQKLYATASKTRAFGEPYSRVDMKTSLSSNQEVYPFVNQADYAKTWYLCSRTHDNGINDKMIAYFKDAVNAVNLNKDPKEALQTASMGTSQLLSQYGLGSYVAR